MKKPSALPELDHPEFDGKQLVSVAKGGLDLGKLKGEAEKKEQESAAGEFKDLTEKIAKSLGERFKEVRVTHCLTDSPAHAGMGFEQKLVRWRAALSR